MEAKSSNKFDFALLKAYCTYVHTTVLEWSQKYDCTYAAILLLSLQNPTLSELPHPIQTSFPTRKTS